MFCFWTAQLNWRCAGSAAKDPSLKAAAGRERAARPRPPGTLSLSARQQRRLKGRGRRSAAFWAGEMGGPSVAQKRAPAARPARKLSARERRAPGASAAGAAPSRGPRRLCAEPGSAAAPAQPPWQGQGGSGAAQAGVPAALSPKCLPRELPPFSGGRAGGAQLARCQPGRRPHSSTLDSGRGRAAASAPPIKIAAALSGSALAAAAATHGPRGRGNRGAEPGCPRALTLARPPLAVLAVRQVVEHGAARLALAPGCRSGGFSASPRAPLQCRAEPSPSPPPPSPLLSPPPPLSPLHFIVHSGDISP